MRSAAAARFCTPGDSLFIFSFLFEKGFFRKQLTTEPSGCKYESNLLHHVQVFGRPIELIDLLAFIVSKQHLSIVNNARMDFVDVQQEEKDHEKRVRMICWLLERLFFV